MHLYLLPNKSDKKNYKKLKGKLNTNENKIPHVYRSYTRTSTATNEKSEKKTLKLNFN